MRAVKRYSIILLVFFLSGCSFTFIYNHVDWWINWYVDDYVDLNKAQQREFDSIIEQTLLWHRQTQLSIYIKQLRKFKSNVNDGISLKQLTEHNRLLRQHWLVLKEKVGPQLVPVAFSLNDKQRLQLLNAINERNNEIRTEHKNLSREEWLTERYDDYHDGFREWFGKLTQDQKENIRQHVQSFKSTFDYWIEFRELWHRQFSLLLNEELERDVFSQIFVELVSNGRELRIPEHRQLSLQNNGVYLEMLHYQLNNMTDKQQRRFYRKLDRYLEDFEELKED